MGIHNSHVEHCRALLLVGFFSSNFSLPLAEGVNRLLLLLFFLTEVGVELGVGSSPRFYLFSPEPPGTMNLPPPSPPLPLPLLFMAPLSLPDPSTTTLPSTLDLKSSTATGLMITDVTLWLCLCCPCCS